MDNQTISTYNHDAENIAKLHNTLTPERIYDLIDMYFRVGMSTVDIGCGIGRDTGWLQKKGFPVIGVDASQGMLVQAKKWHSNVSFIEGYLPELDVLENRMFSNILCSAVLMHLPKDELSLAYQRLASLLEDNGYLILSFRGTTNQDQRENGKLYETIDIAEIQQSFTDIGCTIVFHESEVEEKRQLTWHNLVIKK